MSREASDRPPSRLIGLLRGVRAWLAAIAAVAIIASAVVVGVGRLLMPQVDSIRPWLAEQLSDNLGVPVTIGEVEGRWPGLAPRITLTDVRVGSREAAPLRIARARLELHLPRLFMAGRNPLRLVIVDLDAVIAQDAEGRWDLRLERGAESPPARQGWQALAGDLFIRDARIRVAPHRAPPLEFRLREGEVRRRGDRTALIGRLSRQGPGQAVVELALRARHPDGEVSALDGWIGVERLALDRLGADRWLPDFVTVPAGDRLDADLWLEWQRGSAASAEARFGVSGDGGFSLDGRLRGRHEDGRIDLQLLDVRTGQGPALPEFSLSQRDDLWAIDLPRLDLAVLHRLGRRWMDDAVRWPLALSGEIENLSLLADVSGSLHRLGGRISGFGLDMPGRPASAFADNKARTPPAIRQLDIDLGVAGDRARLALSGSPVIDWPEKMRRDIPFDRVAGSVIISPGAIELSGLRGWRPEGEAHAEGWVWLGGGRPFLDFNIEADRIGAVDPRPWLPVGEIPPQVVEWLDGSLRPLASASGGLNYFFRLGHKFRDWSDGNFQGWVDFRGLDLHYWREWPAATGLDGFVAFVGSGLEAQIDAGRLGDAAVAVERIRIDDLLEPVVDIGMRTSQASAADIQSTLAAMPLDAVSRVMEPMAWTGDALLELDLALPITDISQWRMDGRVRLRQTQLAVPMASLRCEPLSGELRFDRSGIAPGVLDIADAGRLEVSARFGRDPRLDLAGSLTPDDLVADTGVAAELASRMRGAAAWRARLAGEEGGGWSLTLDSDLEGIEFDAPSPLGKPAAAVRPTGLRLVARDGRFGVQGELGELLSFNAQSLGDRWRLAAGLGRPAPELPAEAGFRVAGQLESLDLGAWLRWLGGFDPPAGSTPARGEVSLAVGRLDFGQLRLEPVELLLDRSDSDWRAELDGQAIAGSIRVPIPLDSGRVVAVELDRMRLDRVIREPEVGDLDAAPVPAQTVTRVPGEFPPLHLLIEDLRYRELSLGRLRMESHAREDGVEVERFELVGPNLDVEGHGRWVSADEGAVTEFDGRLISTEIGRLVAALDYDSGIEAARAQVDIDGRWPGSPADFSLARLDGGLGLVLVDGIIPEARPGAGRLIGLARLSAIPRRLMLDFRDVFAEGLKFDRIEGRFTLAEGIARTDGLVIDSPAAAIEVTGKTDMAMQTWDQFIRVEPSVSGTLPVIGGLAGGPAGAAVGLVLRSVLHRPLQGVTMARYHVTGSWSEPEVELVEAQVAEDGDDQPGE